MASEWNAVKSDFKDFFLQLGNQTQVSLQNFLQRMLTTEFNLEQLAGLERIFCELTKSEEMLEVCEDIVCCLWKNAITMEYRESVIAFLLQCIDLMETWKRERLAHHIIQYIHEECIEKQIIFEVLVSLMSKLEESKGVSTSISDRLCASLWNSSNLSALLSALVSRDFQLASMVSFIKKTFECIKSGALSPEDQAISLCTLLRFKDLNLTGMTIEKLNRLFEDMRQNSAKAAVDLLGKMLSCLMSTSKTHEFMTEQIAKTLKTIPVSSVLGTFSFVLAALILSGESKHAQQIMKHLCAATAYTYTSNDLISGSAFLRKVCVPLQEPEATADQILTNCSNTVWSGVVNGLIRYCFALLKSVGGALGRFGCAGVGEGGPLGQGRCQAAKSQRALTVRKLIQLQQQQDHNLSSSSSTLSPKLRISRLAINVLTEIFQALTGFREIIVGTALHYIWSEPGKLTCFQMTELLGELAALCPVEFAEASAESLIPLMECLGTFPLEVSTALLHALLPLFVVSVSSIKASNAGGGSIGGKSMESLVSLQSRVILTLRMMAINYSAPVRRIAVAGFVILLKNLRVRSSNFRTASQQSWSISSHPSATSQPWFSSLASFSQMPISGGFPLFSQINNTQVAQAVTMLPTDPMRNEALCTEIVGLLHRLINSTFFGGTCGPLLNDSAALVKSDIYWGLCEVAVSNRGLVGPVLTLFARLLSASIDPALVKWKPVFKDGAFGLPQAFNGLPLKLSQLISTDPESGSELCFQDHPEVLVWCLQILLSLPLFRHHWSRFARTFAEPRPSSMSESSTSSQFTQSSTQSMPACGPGGLSMRVFSRAASLLINLASGLRETALDEFGLTPDLELDSTAVGHANRARLTMLLGLYDACLEFEAKNLLSAVTDPNATWFHLKRLFAHRESARKLLFHLPDEESKETPTAAASIASTSEVSTNVCFVGTSEGRLRGALLLSGLRSIVEALPRALLSASVAPTFALHLLQTTCARLSELTSTNAGGGGSRFTQQPLLSVVYRAAFVRIVARILRLTIRFYAAHLEAVEGGTQNPVSTESTATAALQTTALCLWVVTEGLGSRRLLRLVCSLYSVAVAPKPLSEDDVDGEKVEGEENGSRDESINIEAEHSWQQSVSNQSRSLTAVVKLFKGWVTRILSATSPSIGASTQHSIKKLATATNRRSALLTDLTILLPMLIRLCEARTALLSATSANNSISSSPIPDFSGLDRVLIWLLRLLGIKEEAFEVTVDCHVAAQTVRLVLQLARLLGSATASASRDSTNVAHRRSSTSTASIADLTWDDLVILLAADVRAILGCIESDHLDSVDKTSLSSQSTSYSPPREPSKKVTFPVVDGKSAAKSVLQVLMSALNQALEDVLWLVEDVEQGVQRDILENGSFATSRGAAGGGGSSFVFTNLPDARKAREISVCDMLLTLGEAVDELLQTSMQPSYAYDVIRLTTGLFDLLVRLTKHYITIVQRNVGTFPATFERVVRLYGRQISPHSYTFVYFVQVREAEKGDTKPTKKAKIDYTFTKPKNQVPSRLMMSRNLKDAKLIPQLIFAVEQYESLLSTLSKRSKVPLIDNICMGLSRDFRINQASALASLEAEAEIDIEADMELPSLSEVEKQPSDKLEDGVGTDNEDDDRDGSGGIGGPIAGRKRPTFCVKYHSTK
ncbi:Fanconi anemia group I protein [Echinococcus granulosus]|uniref:Fanconi anemia group I protein n=1 Tax=Echinococcus granulosus TaxID=6210 RepID=A0A068W9P2_ECHGR|nr:Fanconi anemia group I protein [Echinococcus granulosus]CDS16365.1 Fanconi anemia group I protein [Echinococcus granulosus]